MENLNVKVLKKNLSLLEMKNLQVFSNGTVEDMSNLPGTWQVLKLIILETTMIN